MAESVMDHVVADLRENVGRYFPSHSELRNVRVVGHTPKSDHYIYDIVIDFANCSERVAAKVYRSKANGRARELATNELNNLHYVHEISEKRVFPEYRVPWASSASSGSWLLRSSTACRCSPS